MSMRIVFIADMHTGGLTALTLDPQNKTQEEVLKRYEATVAAFGPKPDALIVNGDSIEGTYPDITDADEIEISRQQWHATDLIDRWKAKEIWIISGTARHTGKTQMWEQGIAQQLRRMGNKVNFRTKGKIEFCKWFRVEARHKIGRSTIPHGRATAPLRAKMWNVIGAALTSRDEGKAAHWPDLCVYAHVHYWQYHEDAFGRVVTLPSWQAHGSRYPDEQCDGHVDLGAFQIEVPEEKGGKVTWDVNRYPAGVVDRWDRR